MSDLSDKAVKLAFNPALGLIHLLTHCLSHPKHMHIDTFNPALGLIHLLT